MPTYRMRLDVNICAPDEEAARNQLPAYIKNFLVIEEQTDYTDSKPRERNYEFSGVYKEVYLLEKEVDGHWEWDDVFDPAKGYTPIGILEERIQEELADNEFTLNERDLTIEGAKWTSAEYGFRVWRLTY